MFLIQQEPSGWKTACPAHEGSVKVRTRQGAGVCSTARRGCCFIARYVHSCGAVTNWKGLVVSLLCRGAKTQDGWKFSFFSTNSQRCFPKSFAPELAQMCLSWARTLKQSRGEVHKTTYDLLQTEVALSF